MNRQFILGTLTERVRDARERRNLASTALDAILKSAPSGIPHPDGAERVRQASQKWAQAQNAFTEALWDLQQFTLRGVVPQNLLPQNIDPQNCKP
jgi:hypothetical protein